VAILLSCSPVANAIIEGTAAVGTNDAGEAGPSPVCGNGELERDESCDDNANPTPGWGCKNDCTGPAPAVCSDGVVTPPEVCDGPLAYCQNCSMIIGSCGDATLQGMEECDTKGASATCDADCTHVACGDRTVNRAANEVCDDGLNDGTPGSCTVDCSDYVAKPADARFASCKDLLASAPEGLRTGFYWLRANDTAAYLAYCDMSSEGGGWTLVMRAIDWNFDYYDPLWSNSTLENAISFDFETKHTRSKYRAYLEVAFTEIRTSELADLKAGYIAAVTQPSALALFGANGGEGVGIPIASGPDALVDYFDARADPDDRQWGCDQFIHVGLNQHALLHVNDGSSTSLGSGTSRHCDWDGGARFGQRVNSCHYTTSGRECSGNHQGQGWGNFNNTDTPLRARRITQLLWVR